MYEMYDIKFLDNNSILSQNQFRIRHVVQTDIALTELTSTVLNIFNKKDKCLRIFFDLAKAFVTASYEILATNWKKQNQRNSFQILAKLFKKQSLVC